MGAAKGNLVWWIVLSFPATHTPSNRIIQLAVPPEGEYTVSALLMSGLDLSTLANGLWATLSMPHSSESSKPAVNQTFFLLPQNSYIEALTPSVIVLESD